MSSPASRVAFLVTAALVVASPAVAQEASIISLDANVRDISDDGRVVVGSYMNPESIGRGFRWTEEGGFEDLGGLSPTVGSYVPAVDGDGDTAVGESYGPDPQPTRWRSSTGMLSLSTLWGIAEGISSDGRFACGHVTKPGGWGAVVWDEAGVMQHLGTLDGLTGTSKAYDMSGDGTYAVGESIAADGFLHPYRWSEAEGLRDLGTFSGGDSTAYAISRDGQFVVGSSTKTGMSRRAFVWTEAAGMKELPAFQTTGLTAAFDVSDDGAVIVGLNTTGRAGGSACVWVDGEPLALIDLLQTYGADLTGWDALGAVGDCSADGTRMIGEGNYQGEPFTGYLITLPPPPTIVAEIERGEIIEASVGQTIEIPFTANDPGGDPLRLFAAGLPASATLTPATGGQPGSSIEGKLTWTPTSADAGVTRDVHLYVRDVENRRASLRFKLKTRDNQSPEIEAPLPVVVECEGGQNLVTLETLVTDPDGDELTVTWSVNGQEEKTESLPAGSLASLEFAYPHGETLVEVEVSDGEFSDAAETTVTVEDTTSPLVVVVPRVTLSVEPGQLYARRSRLVAPQVHDACDEAPTVTNDAPARLPLGKSTVTWQVVDANGNEATATQRVVVENARPVADAGSDVRTSTEAARQSVRLDGRGSYDPDRHELTYRWFAPGVKFDDPHAVRPRGEFPVGVTFVRLAVVDEAGARSQDVVRVVVKRSPSSGANLAATRSSSSAAFESSQRHLGANSRHPSAQAAYHAAEAALAIGSYADEELREGAESGDGLDLYSLLRARQSRQAGAAAELLYGSYLMSGDADALFASASAYDASLNAALETAVRSTDAVVKD